MSTSAGTKKFKDYEVLLRIDSDNGGKRFWMKVETNVGYKNYVESWFVEPPNFIDRWRGITWQDKIAAMEKKLFKKVFNRIEADNNVELNKELTKWLEGANNVQ